MDGNVDRLQQSGFIRFEEEFNQFAGKELADLAVGGASEEMVRVIQRLKQRAEDAAQGKKHCVSGEMSWVRSRSSHVCELNDWHSDP